MVVTIFYTSITSTHEIESQQRHIFNHLEGNGIPIKLVDISSDKTVVEEMKQKTGNPKALAPQIFNGDQYCGDYTAFFNAVENGSWRAFFKLDENPTKPEQHLK